MRELEDFYGDNADEELHCIPRALDRHLPLLGVDRGADGGRRAGHPMGDAGGIRGALRRSAPRRDRGVSRGSSGAAAGRASIRTLATCFGEDFGRLGDLTVIWPLQIVRDLKRRTPFVVELRNIPFRQQEQILFYIADRLPRFLGGAMDARGNGQYLAETARQRYGARIAQVMLSTEWYREQMPRFKAAFEDGTIAIPRDADILLDHRAIVVEHGIAQVGDRRMRGSDRKSRHGDSAIAAALAYFASRQDVAEIDYRPISMAEARRRDPWGPPPDEDSIVGEPWAVAVRGGRVVRRPNSPTPLPSGRGEQKGNDGRLADDAKTVSWICLVPLPLQGKGLGVRSLQVTRSGMSKFWKWKCEQCGHEFTLSSLRGDARAVPSMRRRVVSESRRIRPARTKILPVRGFRERIARKRRRRRKGYCR